MLTAVHSIILSSFSADPEVPGDLLEAILQSKLPPGTAADISGNVDSEILHSSMHDYLAAQLEVRILL